MALDHEVVDHVFAGSRPDHVSGRPHLDRSGQEEEQEQGFHHGGPQFVRQIGQLHPGGGAYVFLPAGNETDRGAVALQGRCLQGGDEQRQRAGSHQHRGSPHGVEFPVSLWEGRPGRVDGSQADRIQGQGH